MSLMNEHHHKAMDLAARGLYERTRGNHKSAIKLFTDALDFEIMALSELNDPIQPTHSVLHRSAATLALDCDRVDLAIKLASKALAEEPPVDIRDELLDVVEQAKFQHNLAKSEVKLEDDGMEMSATGASVGRGVVPWNDFQTRVGDSFRLLQRIIERKSSMPFRDRGRPPKKIEDYPMLVSVPRAGSFAVTLNLANPMEPTLPGMSEVVEYIDEFMDLMEMVNSSDFQAIQERIPDTPYLKNFIALAKNIAPDGQRIKRISFATRRAGVNRHVLMDKSKSQLQYLKVPELPEPEAKHVEISGTLRFADATRANLIKIIDEEDKSHTIVVPEGLMNDIVRPMWDLDVVVNGIRKGEEIELQEIELQEIAPQ